MKLYIISETPFDVLAMELLSCYSKTSCYCICDASSASCYPGLRCCSSVCKSDLIVFHNPNIFPLWKCFSLFYFRDCKYLAVFPAEKHQQSKPLQPRQCFQSPDAGNPGPYECCMELLSVYTCTQHPSQRPWDEPCVCSVCTGEKGREDESSWPLLICELQAGYVSAACVDNGNEVAGLPPCPHCIQVKVLWKQPPRSILRAFLDGTA